VAESPGPLIEYEPLGTTGKVRMTFRLPDGFTHTDKFDVTVEAERLRFLDAACDGRDGIDRKQVADRLEEIAAVVVQDSTGAGRRRVSQADLLVELADGVELFHSPGADADPFAVVAVGGHRETWPLNAAGFRRWLAKRYYEEHGKTPGAQAVQDALAVLTGRAQFDGPECPVAVRVAAHKGDTWLDLGDPDWQAVRIGTDGWEVVTDPPVRFARRRGMLPLPVPVHGGRVDDLRPLVNLPDDDQWVLFVAWLVAALRPGRPLPVLAVNGEQGSAKSTLCKMGRGLIDPNEAPLRRAPKEERDLVIAASNGWVVGFDNMSGIPPPLSDALCCLSTGGGFGTRQLYTDDEEKLFSVLRPVVVNGIEDLATRPDLLDRAVRLTLPAIPGACREDEDRLWAEFERVRPGVLGALLDAASRALRDLAAVRLPSKPRMADFAKWVTAAETALGWSPGRFLSVYAANRREADELALECSPVAALVVALVEELGRWEGTSGELLKVLNARVAEDVRKSREWPGTPRGLSGHLRRLAPNLRRVGVACQFPDREPGGDRRRVLVLERVGDRPSRPSRPPGSVGDGRDGVPGGHSSPVAEEVVEWTG
jgi:hypothetical protein